MASITDGAPMEASTPADPANLTPAEHIEKARAAGWTETTAFDYAAFQQQGGDDTKWLGNAAVYEWSGEYGDVAPEVPALEKLLYGSDLITREGEHRQNIELEVALEGPVQIKPVQRFEDAALHPVMMSNIQKCGYTRPTPIQAYAIPAVSLGHDVVAVAQTGSGKTAAYFIPIISKLMGKAKKLAAPRPDVTSPSYDARLSKVRAEPLVVVVVPTRELAIQIFDEARRMCYRSMLRPCVAYGGLPLKICLEELGKGCDILIATPGRLCDFMNRPEALTMSRIKYTVIDEADEMLGADWQDELDKIMAGGDTNEDADHVFMMFSATFPKGARELARKYMAQDYIRIRVGRVGQSHRNIRQEVIYVDQNQKREALNDLLLSMTPGLTFIFCNSKTTVDLTDDFLYNRGFPTTSIHSGRNQREREDSIRAFRKGDAPILLTTGVSARGWDVKNVKYVINYDLPSGDHGGITEYVHRIGRTGRIGNQGLATSFYSDRDEGLAQALVNTLIECECKVPDFLQSYIPEGGALEFDDDTDDEAEADEEGGDTAWGGAEAAEGGAPLAPGGWGAAPDVGTDAGFTPAAAGTTVAISSW